MSLEQLRAKHTATASQRQQQAARPEASVWVAASAGTGKTKVLTDRVFSLLLAGTAPERILCLTFTKTAAAEMAGRLTQRLGRWTALNDNALIAELTDLLGTAPDEERITMARQLFARVLDTPGGMKIQTIHAFCQGLLGRFPLEAGVPPNFGVLDERSAQELLQDAQAEIFSRAQSPGGEAYAEAIETVSAEVDENSFTQVLADLIKERGRLQRLLRRYGGVEDLAPVLRRALQLTEEETRDSVLAASVADSALDLMGLRLCAETMASGGKEDQDKARRIGVWLAASAQERLAGLNAYLAAFFTDGGLGPARKRLIGKPSLGKLPGADQILTVEVARLDQLRSKLNALRVLNATLALVRLGGAVMTVYGRKKRRRALLDYDDLVLETRDLLRRPGVAPWVLYRLDGGLDHILIDEAQDTNPDQWEVIRTLAEEFFVGEGSRSYVRTVFAVGDAKQSIFSFQRADPQGFTDMREHFARRARAADLTWDKVDLAVSFRSTAAVLAAVDAVFAEAPARDGVLFDDESITHDPVRVGQAGVVEIWPAAEPESLEDPEAWAPPISRSGVAPPASRLAALIAQRIWHWTVAVPGESDVESSLQSRGRRLQPGDFLVLVRRRNSFVDELVRALKQRDVPVAGVDRMVLTEQLAVMDLIAFGRALLLPEDDLNLAAVLKSPLIGLDEEALFDLAYGREGSLWQELRRRRHQRPDFGAAYDRLAAFRAQADFKRPYELYSELLGPGNGRRQLFSRLGLEARDPIDEFLAQVLTYELDHAVSLEGFLHWLEAGSQEVKRDMEHGGNAVRVMTVHGAKGLQAPVVILPDTLQLPQAVGGPFWINGEAGLVVWPPRKAHDGPLTKAARDEALRLRDQEYRRLLYVGLTRAEDRLYVCGWATQHKAPEHCWYNMIERALAQQGEPVDFDFRSVIKGGWAGPGWRLSTPQALAAERVEQPATKATVLPPLPGWAQAEAPAEPTPPRPLAPSRPTTAEPATLSPSGPDALQRFHRGRLVHSLLQYLPALAVEQRRAAGARYLASPAHDLAPDQQQALLEETLAVLEDERFHDLFGPDSRAEVPIAGTIETKAGPEVVFGQVDRLVVTEDRVSIIDYKTNRPAPRTADAVPALYLRQLALYRAVLTGLYPDKRIDCALLWTEAPHLMQISDAQLAQQAP